MYIHRYLPSRPSPNPMVLFGSMDTTSSSISTKFKLNADHVCSRYIAQATTRNTPLKDAHLGTWACSSCCVHPTREFFQNPPCHQFGLFTIEWNISDIRSWSTVYPWMVPARVGGYPRIYRGQAGSRWYSRAGSLIYTSTRLGLGKLLQVRWSWSYYYF
jgi:hypothetical protein